MSGARRILFACAALALAIAVAWIDTRPHWDDTGVSALLVAAAAGLAAFGGVPLAFAVLLGVGPLLLAHIGHWNEGLWIAPAIALAGALLGAWLRRNLAGGEGRA
jgi:hypothetical protein